MNILLSFKCPTAGCGYTEDVGVDVSIGLLIVGDFTTVCPRCGAVGFAKNSIACTPVRINRQIPRTQP